MNEHILEPQAYYEGLDYPISLPRDLSGVHVRIDQSKTDPVISIDSDGLIHGLRKGEATITAEFAGMRDRMVVVVK